MGYEESLTVAQAARRRGVTSATVRRWVHQGLLPASRPGRHGHLRISTGDLDDMSRPLPGRPPETLAGAVNGVLALAAQLTPDQRDRLFAAIAGTIAGTD